MGVKEYIEKMNKTKSIDTTQHLEHDSYKQPKHKKEKQTWQQSETDEIYSQ